MIHCTLIHSLNGAYDKTVISALTEQGFRITEVPFEKAADSAVFSNTDAVIVCGGADCAAGLSAYADAYLNAGGSLIVLGGPPFQTEHYCEAGGKTSDDLAAMLASGEYGKRLCMDFSRPLDSYGFVPDTENPDSKKVEITASLSIEQDKRFSHRLVWHSEHFSINESFEAPFSLKEGENVIGFYARADENTQTLTIKLIDSDGNVFKARMTPEEEYRFFMLSARDFVYD